MTEDTAIAIRWAAQGLDARTLKETPAQIASRLLAMQGQDDLAVQWAVGVRAGCREQDVRAALEEGSIVRTWPMRGTLHLMAAEDVRWMLGLLSPIMLSRMGPRFAEAGLDGKALSLAEKVLLKALADGPVTREALMQALQSCGLRVDDQRGYLTLWFHAHSGLICCGPKQGKKPTFALLDSWVPASRPLDRDEALARLALRYFQGHGPATAQDLAHWTALTPKQAREAAESVGSRLVSFKIGPLTYWSGSATPAGSARGLTLLPGFDEYLLGYKDRSWILRREHAALVVPGGNGVFKPLIVQDGRIVGTWRRQLKARGVEVSFQPFADSPDPKALHQAAEDYARFLGLELSVLS